MKNFFIGQQSFLQTHAKSFVHLHLHTQYSLLDGALKLKDLFKKAKEAKMPAVACTDHGNMFGAIDFYKQALENNIKPILGSEIYFTAGSRFDRRSFQKNKVISNQDGEENKYHIHHLVLLCKNEIGYKNLCKLISKAYLEGFYYKPRADIELLKEYSEGLIATTACLKGEVNYNFFIDEDKKAIEAIHKLQEVYKDDFYLEIQENGLQEQKKANLKILDFAKKENVKVVATCDTHYLNKEDSIAQEVLLCIQTGKTFEDEDRMKMTTQEFYFKTPEEMRVAFNYMEEACDATLKIADECNVSFDWKDSHGKQIYHLPSFKEDNPEEMLKKLAFDGLDQRFKHKSFTHKDKKLYQERLEEELALIIKMGFTGYFLIVADFIGWAKEKKIPVGPGRGSGAGSLVAYSLKITDIDPIEFQLLFERFINPDRISLPDFDIDFCKKRREEVIHYVTQKYGKERVAQIITFGKLQAKAAIRDVARVFSLPYKEADALAKLIPDELGISLEESLEKEPRLMELMDKDLKIKKIMNIAQKLEGLFRHASIHAAGIIITNEPLDEYAPLFRGKNGEQVVQFDKDFCELIGLVKFDFLGLKTLTVLSDAVKLIQKHTPDFILEDILLDDKKTYELISSGKTIGIFQLESSGMMELCKQVQPDCLDDITAVNALFRPGPLGSSMDKEFIERKRKKKPVIYLFPELEKYLKDTQGIIIYQEQVMNISREVAGYTLAQADLLRRAMGKKKPEEMEKQRSIFLQGAEQKGYPKDKSLELFNLMEKFAEYGFNKSHAAAYAYIAYQTAYLKSHYPGEFFASILSSEMDDLDKLLTYLKDIKDFGYRVVTPCVNKSQKDFSLDGKNILYGLGAVKNVGEKAIENLIQVRSLGAFTSFESFLKRVDLFMFNKKVLEALILVGAFDSIDTNRKKLFENFPSIVERIQKDKKKVQLAALLPFYEESQEMTDVVDFSIEEKLQFEFEYLGYYLSGHPLDQIEPIIKSLKLSENQTIGILSQIKLLQSKKGPMCFAVLETFTKKMDLVFFPKVFEEFKTLLKEKEFVFIEAKESSQEKGKFFVEKFFILDDFLKTSFQGVKIYIENNFQDIKEILIQHKGLIPVHLILERPDGKFRIPLEREYDISLSKELIKKLLNYGTVEFF